MYEEVDIRFRNENSGIREKAQILADKLNNILPLIDGFMNSLDDEDFELLEESKQALKERININKSAMPLIMACGGNYDDTEDRMKIKTLDCLIDLIKVRKEFREEKIKAQNKQQNMQEVLNLFGIMGMM